MHGTFAKYTTLAGVCPVNCVAGYMFSVLLCLLFSAPMITTLIYGDRNMARGRDDNSETCIFSWHVDLGSTSETCTRISSSTSDSSSSTVPPCVVESSSGRTAWYSCFAVVAAGEVHKYVL